MVAFLKLLVVEGVGTIIGGDDFDLGGGHAL